MLVRPPSPCDEFFRYIAPPPTLYWRNSMHASFVPTAHTGAIPTYHPLDITCTPHKLHVAPRIALPPPCLYSENSCAQLLVLLLGPVRLKAVLQPACAPLDFSKSVSSIIGTAPSLNFCGCNPPCNVPAHHSLHTTGPFPACSALAHY